MLTSTLRTIASALQTPVIVLLIILVVIIVVMIGMLLGETFTERAQFKLSMPKLIDDLDHGNAEEAVKNSGLLLRQKKALLEVLSHPDASPEELEALAVDQVAQEQAHYDNRVKVTDLIAKIAPMLGLMGTLIPLGPGLIGIGEGNTEVLSQSLLIAFDTTVLGLVVAAVALVISTIRKSWYAKYANAFETAMEAVLSKAIEASRKEEAGQ